LYFILLIFAFSAFVLQDTAGRQYVLGRPSFSHPSVVCPSVNTYSVSQKRSPLKLFCDIFTHSEHM